MEDSELINNIPCCPICHNPLGGISDYDLVELQNILEVYGFNYNIN